MKNQRYLFGPGNRAAAKPEGTQRVSVSLRLPPAAAEKLRAHAGPAVSQGDIVAALLKAAKDAAGVVRFQGGANAGHTIVNELGEFRLHLVPSGIFRPEQRRGDIVGIDDLVIAMHQHRIRRL